jgi:hypothetical protein
MEYRLTAREDGDMAVDSAKLPSFNLWREIAYSGLYMSSDQFQRRLNEEKLVFFEPRKATEI